MQASGDFIPAVVAGSFLTLLGILCFVFNRKVGRWLRRLPLAIFGLKERAAVEEMIFRGLACLLGLLYIGFGLVLLTALFK
ncbi:MAG: hypothetical protein M3444_16270 [Acidobacteriota bacterium]|nr:hypothetical protein [Acidobacteriota bacterium]MDQ5837839.1 hypothetical protein [Acidobacteriota bacterium]